MPHTHFFSDDPALWTYDDETDTFDQNVSIEEALRYVLTQPDRQWRWDYADLKARIQRPVSRSYTPSKFNGCDLEQYLKIHHNYSVNPQDVSRMAGGSNSHAGLETDIDDIYSEVTVCRELVDPEDGYRYPIIVRPDKVYIHLGLIHDDKTRAYLPTQDKVVLTPEATPEIIRQLSIGAWAWADPKWVDFGDGVKREHAPIKITRGEVIYRQADFTKQVRDLLDLDLGHALESWMLERCRDLRRMYEGERPRPIQDADAMWRCESCPVRPHCDVDFDKRVKLKRARAAASRQKSKSRSR